MKNILKTAAATAALIGFVGNAQAQTHSSSSTVYSAPALPPSFGQTGTIQIGPITIPVFGFIPGQTSEQQFANNVGSRYRQDSTAPDNEDGATTTAGGTFTLTGKVLPDCSFYNGNGAGASNHTIDLGTIGVRTMDSNNVSQAFNQVSAATAHVDTATAGCNTANTVTITKTNDALLNSAPGSYDSAQFTASIPYSINASWNNAGNKTLALGATSGNVHQNSLSGGAWRSSFAMDVNIPVQQKGLVAGTYSDKITVTVAVQS